MAEIDDLFLALEKADAAGNKEDARELAKMIAISSGEVPNNQLLNKIPAT